MGLHRLLASAAAASVLVATVPPAPAREGPSGFEAMAFWSRPRRGANGGLTRLRPEWFEAASAAGLEWIRFHPDILPAAGRDFLIGDADEFRQVDETDLALLRRGLDMAHAHGLKVVLVMFSLPGCRWKQLNGDRDDGRLWRDEAYQQQSLEFWRQLAGRLKGHPAVVGWNPLNEPHPDREFGFEDPEDPAFAGWLRASERTTADLNRFNRRMVAAIREVDPDTPIMLDGWFYADPAGFAFNQPVDDARTLYALHNPGPWHYTTWRINKGRFAYPDRMARREDEPPEPWTIADLERILAPVGAFARRHGIPAERIVASELWCDRRVEGAAAYLADAISLYEARRWHWAFYQFRPDGAWTGLDYEIPPDARFGSAYWEAAERGEDVEALKPRGDTALWRVIRRGLAPD